MNKFMLILAAALLLAPQFAAAKLSMCVDPANLDSGNRSAAKARQKTWKSEVDTRKTGLDFNAERRGLHQNGATASMK